MTLDTPPTPAPPKRGDADSRLFGRLLITVIVGFGLPVMACYIVAGEAESEEDFLKAMHTALRAMGITPKKMLCGIEHRLRTPDGPLRTRSLMLAELSPDESRRLQEQGLGSFRHLGCGLFLPHKGIQELHPVLE